MRPTLFQVGGVLYWTILTRNPDTGLLKDADSTPTIAVRKNGAAVGDSVTITKRSATTGVYDCSYNPASEVEGDAFTFEESATVTGTTTAQGTYNFNWSVRTVRTGAVELDSATITTIKSGLATAAALADVQTDVDAANNYLSALYGVFSGITSMANWLRRAFRKDAGTAGMTTAETEINNTGGAFVGTTDSLEAIRDNQSAGGGTAPTIVTLQSVAGISPGVILGPTEPLVIGDDYLTSLGRSVRINLLDSAGEPAEVVFGDKSLADAGVSIQLLLARSGKPTTVADLVGTCTFFPAVGDIPPYLMVEFTRVETAKAIPGPYDMQAEAVWSDGKVVTFAPYGQVSFVRNIRRV